MEDTLSQLHFLRPEWFLLLPLWGLLLWGLPRLQSAKTEWSQWIAPSFHELLVVGSQVKDERFRQLRWILSGLWLLGTIALAGPAWERLPQPLLVRDQARVILLDLSYSMLATDLQPNRLERARYKVEDLLNRLQEGQTALIAYAGDAHTIVPLTEDVETIRSLLPSLHPSLMPVRGSRADLAIKAVQQLLQQAQVPLAHLIWITDGVPPEQLETLRSQLKTQPLQLSILALGTPEGAPIVLEKGNYLKDANNHIVIPQLDWEPLQELAALAGGQVLPLQFDDSDLERLVALEEAEHDYVSQEEQLATDRWREEGPWLLLLALPLAAVLFRRGWLFGVLWFLPLPSTAQAWEWQHWFQNQNQQAYQLLEQGKAGEALERFDDPAWQGAAAYQAQRYEDAAGIWSQQEDPTAAYNQGNALARAGQLEQALQAYDQALATRPEWEDAQFNRDLVAKLLEEQQSDQANRSTGGNPNRPPEGETSSQEEEANQSASSGGEPESNETPETSEAASGDSVQNDQVAADQAPEEDQNQGAEESTGQQAQQSQSKEQAGSASGPQSSESRTQTEPRDKPQDPELTPTQTMEETESEENPTETAAYPTNPAAAEQQQTLEQWLRRVPDDPGQLLRNKMRLESLRLRQAQQLEHEPEFW